MYTGSCLCGTVRFRISGEPGLIQICHCSQCRKAQGGPFASNIPVSTDQFEITEGREQLKALESVTRQGKYRVFCQSCGSPVVSRMDSRPGVVRVRAGLINEPLNQRIAHHQFVAYKADWYNIVDDAPQYNEFPPE